MRIFSKKIDSLKLFRLKSNARGVYAVKNNLRIIILKIYTIMWENSNKTIIVQYLYENYMEVYYHKDVEYCTNYCHISTVKYW